MTKFDTEPADIVIVDDSRANLRLLEMMLSQHHAVHSFDRAAEALAWARENPPDIFLLDLIMPVMDGLELCRHLKAHSRLKDIPVIFISSKNDIETKVQAFNAGGVDYITKPFEVEELHTRVHTHLQISRMRVWLTMQNQELERLVEQKVREISDAQLATIMALAKLAESRDDDTGIHLERVQVLCALLAEQLSKSGKCREHIDEDFIRNIYHASALHDVGKVGIPDQILLKPGKLSVDEFEIIKTHTVIGADTLEAVRCKYQGNAFIEMGISIARWHHERWDGRGYPDGLAGYAIPLAARIVAVADVFDALSSERCYKKAYPHAKCVEIIREGRASQFAPDVVDAFLALEKQLDTTLDALTRYVTEIFS